MKKIITNYNLFLESLNDKNDMKTIDDIHYFLLEQKEKITNSWTKNQEVGPFLQILEDTENKGFLLAFEIGFSDYEEGGSSVYEIYKTDTGFKVTFNEDFSTVYGDYQNDRIWNLKNEEEVLN